MSAVYYVGSYDTQVENSLAGQTLLYLRVATGAHIVTFSLLPPCLLYTMWAPVTIYTQVEKSLASETIGEIGVVTGAQNSLASETNGKMGVLQYNYLHVLTVFFFPML